MLSTLLIVYFLSLGGKAEVSGPSLKDHAS